MTDFPNCRAIGLEVTRATTYVPTSNGFGPAGGSIDYANFVRASDLESLLAKGVRVRSWGNMSNWSADLNAPAETHEGLIIDIQPIKRDTAEDLLRELMDKWGGVEMASPEWIKRARRYLEDKK